MSISPAQDADPNEAALLTALERARALADAGQYVASLVEGQRLLKLVPWHPHILHLIGVAHVQLGNQLLAMKHLDLALQQLPGFAMLHAHRGEALRRGGLLEEAVQSCRRALELDPGCREARHNLVVSLLDLGQSGQALAELDAMTGPGLPDPQQQFQRARALIDLGRAQPAAEALQALVAVEPHVAEAWSALAVARLLQDDLVGARAAAERATSIAPGLPQGWLQAGDIAIAERRDEDAVAAYSQALRIAPDFAAARYQLSLALLGLGRFREGWQHYESRFDPSLPGGGVPMTALPMPRWAGEPLAGRRLLVLTEQGFGDTIQYIRFLPQLLSAGVQIELGASPDLEALMRRLPGVQHVTSRIESVWASRADFWMPVASLPLYLGLEPNTIPAQVPYLTADAQACETWRARLAALGPGLRVGLVWAGRATHANDFRRSLPWAHVAALGPLPGVHFVSVQKGPAAVQARGHTGWPLLAAGEECRDFAETAAVLGALDLLISVDSAPAHLAGALGLPVWTLLPHSPDWRWRMDGEHSRWYPTMRLFRQPAPGDWHTVIARVRDALNEAVAKGPAAVCGHDPASGQC